MFCKDQKHTAICDVGKVGGQDAPAIRGVRCISIHYLKYTREVITFFELTCFPFSGTLSVSKFFTHVNKETKSGKALRVSDT